jgi:hypothetical protein
MGDFLTQKNGYDCGVFMLTAAIFLCEGLHDWFSSESFHKVIPLARYKIAIDIYQGYIWDFRINNPTKAITIHDFKTTKAPDEDNHCSLFVRDCNFSENYIRQADNSRTKKTLNFSLEYFLKKKTLFDQL